MVVLTASRPLIALDCKYKQLAPGDFINSDVYQLLAYSTALNVDTGLIAYPKSEVASPGSIRVTSGGPEISQVLIDLDVPREEMPNECDRFATLMANRMPAAIIANTA